MYKQTAPQGMEKYNPINLVLYTLLILHLNSLKMQQYNFHQLRKMSRNDKVDKFLKATAALATTLR